MQSDQLQVKSMGSVGIFWEQEGRLHSPGSSQHSKPRTTSIVQLPQLAQSPSSRSSSALPLFEYQGPPRDSAAMSLLRALHKLLRGIKDDMDRFMESMRAMDTPTDNTVHFVGQHGPRYYFPAVAAEDREFFVHEREMDADRETATTLARERHCAVVDKQFYSFDHGNKYGL